ncbi:hypothetical protein MS3_00000970 [Schistosoma haematobium]|uniref:Uncharacterized protein n=1 Tax=Schistosoma haematobium TaxID=6185 RepID=A0A922M012_SCHHA|nr:hypothetical protein MS3_00000970 [Schistosoma haematobium]KAH9596946.1 hypothetical protein MS3_00000970 [Schistosoma haematobium]
MGALKVKGNNGSGMIFTYLQNGVVSEYQISNGKKLLAVRMIFHRNVDGKNVELKVLNLIHPSGKISIYYENVPEEMGKNELRSNVYGRFECGGNKCHLYSDLH